MLTLIAFVAAIIIAQIFLNIKFAIFKRDLLDEISELNVRAKDEKGRFVADDKSTPEVNEAYKTGRSPRKKNAKN